MQKNNNNTVVAVVAVLAILVIGGVIFGTANNKSTKNDKPAASNISQPAATVGSIVTVASETPTLSTLVTAVKAASLVDTLNGTGPFTVFAPTNAAFEALPAGTLDTLLKPENVDQLKSILTYHVVAGKVMAADLKDGQVISTVQGAELTVSLMDGKAYLIDAKGNKVQIQKADVETSNGVVHVIGGVLLPA